MSEPHHRGDRGLDDSVAAWLVPVAASAADVPVRCLRPHECLELARAALAAATGTHGSLVGPEPAAAGAVVDVAQGDQWLAHADGSASGASGEMPLACLAASLVLPGDDRSSGLPGRGVVTVEAAVLRESLRLAAAHVELRNGFDRAVADSRIEAMRELAYGAGHEINNPLANIATRAQALLLEESDPERRRRLSTIVDQSFRARDMIGGMMVFARPPKPRLEPTAVDGIVTAAIESVRPQAATRGVRLEYSPSPVSLEVFVDRVQVEEAVRVVLVNALEAAAAGGRVVVRAARVCDGATWRCEITVEDNGRGMPLEQVKRAFDPFFSGREAGRGAGMGLPKAWRLIESSRGDVVIDSRPGHGTRVVVRLPQGPAGLEASSTPDERRQTLPILPV